MTVIHMTKRRIFLISAKGRSVEELKCEARQALQMFRQSGQPPATTGGGADKGKPPWAQIL